MQIDQPDQTFNSSTEVRNPNLGPNGKFLPGNNANPNGSPKINEGWQRYGDRAKVLGEKYTADEIAAFAESKYLRSQLTYWDAMTIMHMARALDPTLTKTKAGTDDLRGERKELLDRIEGQSKAQTEVTGANGSAIMPLIKIVFEGNNEPIPELTLPAVEPLTITQEPVTIENVEFTEK